MTLKQLVRDSLHAVGLEVYRYRPGTQAPRVVDISDDYTRRLYSINAGMCVPGNLHLFDHAIKNLPGDAPIVEIGIWAGLSTNLLTYYKRQNGRHNPLINCDRWGGEEENGAEPVGESGFTLAHVRAHIRESYLLNVQRFSRGDLPHTFELLSGELFDAWRRGETRTDMFGRDVRLGGPVGFAFIDGAHDYDNVRADFEMCDEHLARGGFLLFDDSSPEAEWPGVQRVAEEVMSHPRYELVAANPYHLFRKK